jgi:hypothetical protein
LPRSLLNPEIQPGARSPRWPRRWRFAAVIVSAGLGWLIPMAILYLVFWWG